MIGEDEREDLPESKVSTGWTFGPMTEATGQAILGELVKLNATIAEVRDRFPHVPAIFKRSTRGIEG